MNEEIIGQSRFLLLSLCLGMSYICGYDLLRFFRWLIPHNTFWIWIEDILYWCLAAFPGFYVFFLFNQGVIRWFGVLAVLVGAVLYEYGISKIIRRQGNRILSPGKRKLYAGWKMIRRYFGKNAQRFQKNFKKRLQKQKK